MYYKCEYKHCATRQPCYYTSLSISRTSLTDRSRPCSEILFLFSAPKKAPITSALYPYVQTRACGMSTAKYSSGQKTVDGASAGADDVGLEMGICACSGRVTIERLARLWNQDLRPLDLFIVSLLPWLALAAAAAAVAVAAAAFTVSQIPRGWPRRPWTNTILWAINQTPRMWMGAVILQANLVVAVLYASQPCEVEPKHLRHVGYTR